MATQRWKAVKMKQKFDRQRFQNFSGSYSDQDLFISKGGSEKEIYVPEEGADTGLFASVLQVIKSNIFKLNFNQFRLRLIKITGFFAPNLMIGFSPSSDVSPRWWMITPCTQKWWLILGEENQSQNFEWTLIKDLKKCSKSFHFKYLEIWSHPNMQR